MTFQNTSVLIPVDGSGSAGIALDYGLDLAEELGLPVKIIHVLNSRPDNLEKPRRIELDDLEKFDASEHFVQLAFDAINQARDAAGSRKLDVEYVLLVGDPAQAIVEYAGECDRPFIVIGRRGLGPLKLLLLGSVSDKVIRHADCPVAVVN